MRVTGCQRWRSGHHRWRSPGDGGFDPARYEVHPLAEADAKRFVTGHHYSGSYPASSRRFGLYERGVLVGAAVFGIPASRAVLSNTFPDLEPYRESLELSRFVLLDEVPANGESWFLARCHHELVAGGVRGVVAFADPVPRRTATGLVFPGHVGFIYQASNAVFCGRSTPRSLVLLPDGTTFSDRAAQKVRRGERGHRYAAERLVALGAPPPDGDRARWLADALDAVGATRLRHRGCLRYAFALGHSARARRAVMITPSPGPYPKATDPG